MNTTTKKLPESKNKSTKSTDKTALKANETTLKLRTKTKLKILNYLNLG